MSDKIVEVRFNRAVRLPHNQHRTQVLATNRDAELGSPIRVDSIDEEICGVLVKKTIDTGDVITVHKKLYAWSTVDEVLYEPSRLVTTPTDIVGPKLKSA